MLNELQQLLILINKIGVEAAIKTIDVDDPTIKIILRTTDHSIQRLRDKLNTA